MAIKKFVSEILEIRELTPSVKSYKLSVPKDFEFKAGQFIVVNLSINGENIRRPYSIASSPNKKGSIELCIKKVDNGPVSEFMHNLTEKEKLNVYGPLGRFIIDESSKNKDVVFISAGTGISTFVSMIPYLLEAGFRKRIILIQGVRSEDDIFYEKELSELKEKYPNFNFHIVLSQPKDKGYKNTGYVQNFIDIHVPEDFDGDFYLCGLSNMVTGVNKLLKEKNVQEERIIFEEYD